MTVGLRIGRADRVRAALANGPLAYDALATAIGEKSAQVKRGLWQMKHQGFLTHEGGRWALTDKVPLPRYATKAESIAAKKAARQRFTAKLAAEKAAARARQRPVEAAPIEAPSAKPVKAARPPRARPATPKTSRALRIVSNDMPVPFDLTLPATPKHDPRETDAFIAANPDCFERLPAFGAPIRREEGPVAQKNRERRAWNESLPRKRA